MRLCSEMLHGIRLVKMQAWEVPVMQRILVARHLEMAFLGKRKYLDAICVYLWAATPVLVSLATFGSVLWLDPARSSPDATFLPASSVFTAVALLNMLIFPMNAFPWVIAGLLEARVSLRRLSAFLLAAADTPRVPTFVPDATGDSSVDSPAPGALAPLRTSNGHAVRAPPASYRGVVVRLQGSFAYSTAADSTVSEKANDLFAGGQTGAAAAGGAAGDGTSAPAARAFVLQDLDLEVYRGELIVVCGAVGAGKSTLLQACLGEIAVVAGSGDGASYVVGTTTAFAPQVSSVAELCCHGCFSLLTGPESYYLLALADSMDPQRRCALQHLHGRRV